MSKKTRARRRKNWRGKRRGWTPFTKGDTRESEDDPNYSAAGQLEYEDESLVQEWEPANLTKE